MHARFLERLPAHPRFFLWGAAVATGLLVLLAGLQYRWTGEVSRAERDRLRASLDDACRRFEEDFNSEFVRLFGFLQAGGPPRFPPSPQNLAMRFENWRNVSPHAAMVGGLYFVQEGDLMRLNEQQMAFERVSWPARLDRLRSRLERLPGAGPPIEGPPLARRGPGRLRGGPIVDPEAPALAIPLAPMAGGPRWVVIEMDRDYLTAQYVPQLMARHFGETFRASLVVAGVAGQPTDGGPPERRPPDAVAPLLQLPLGIAAERRPPHLRPPAGRRQPAPWELHVWLAAGSPEQVVRRAQFRNLGLSLAVLLLLGGSIALLLTAARNAQRLAQLQMDFVAGVSHELRTPLAVICSAGDNLADGVVTGAEQIRRYGGVVRGEGRRLSRIVEQILRYTSLDRKPVDFEAVDVATAIDAALAANQSDLDAAAVQMDKQVTPDLPPVVAEKTSLVHCVSNLINNAAKHAAAGGWIGVSARVCDGQRAVAIIVQDHGPGISAADLPYVFDPFYRGRAAISGQVRGLGLGLNLVKRIVEAHGGSVAVTSVPGDGSAFEIRLPVAEKGVN